MSEDSEAPIAYIRQKGDYKLEDTKFSYEHEVESVRATTKVLKLPDERTETEVSNETVKSMHTRKVTLKVYSHSNQEDCEHFFECFEKLQKELDEEWLASSQAKDKDATVLFKAFEHMLNGVATSEWHDVLQNETDRTWETFKILVSIFISTKILKENAYDAQVRYMQERGKPKQLNAKDWWLRMQAMNCYLPYFMKNMDMLKRQAPTANFKDWWNKGGSLSDTELRRIVTSKAPEVWQIRLSETDIGHEYRDNKPTSELVEYFTTLEALEQRRNRMRGRIGQTRNNNNRQYNSRGSGRFANTGRTGRSNNPRRFNSYGSSSGSRYGTSFVNRYGSVDPRYQPRRQEFNNTSQGNTQGSRNNPQLHQNQGGRTGTSTSGRHSGRFAGQRNARGGFQQGGRFQGQQFHSRYQRPSGGQAYFQEDEESQNDDFEHYNVQEEAEECKETEEAMMTEDQWIDAWNESLYVDAPDDEETEDFGEEAYYGEEEDFNNAPNDAAFYGSYYG